MSDSPNIIEATIPAINLEPEKVFNTPDPFVAEQQAAIEAEAKPASGEVHLKNLLCSYCDNVTPMDPKDVTTKVVHNGQYDEVWAKCNDCGHILKYSVDNCPYPFTK